MVINLMVIHRKGVLSLVRQYIMEAVSEGLGAKLPGFISQFCHLLAVWLYACHLTSLCFNFHSLIAWLSGWQCADGICLFYQIIY